MRKVRIFKIQSTVSLFYIRKFVKNLWNIEERLELAKMETNFKKILKQRYQNMEKYGFIQKKSRIFLFAEMEDKHPITYDKNGERAFNVHSQ
jgi:hypothetical protein